MPIGSVYGVVDDEETGIGIHPCDVILITGLEEVIEETYEGGGYIIDALPGSGYGMRFESPEYETKTVSNVTLYANSFTYVPVTLKKKEVMTEDDSLYLFMKKAPLILKAKMQFRRDFYIIQKKQVRGAPVTVRGELARHKGEEEEKPQIVYAGGVPVDREPYTPPGGDPNKRYCSRCGIEITGMGGIPGQALLCPACRM